MRNFSLTILFILLCPMLLLAEIELRFRDGSPEGHKFVEHKVNKLSKQDLISSENYADSLRQILINSGFANSTVIVNNIKSETLIEIEFGDQFYIGRLLIEGDKIDTINYDKLFAKSEYEKVIDSILETYQNNGFYFVNLLAQKYEADNNRVNIYLYLQTGPVVEISSIEFEGIQKTDPKLLKRYVNISKGDRLDSKKISESWENLKDIEYLFSKRPPEIIPEPGYNKARVRFNLSESKLLRIEGAGGYIPDDNGRLVGYLDFKLQNYFGGGRTINFLLDKREKSRSLQHLQYGQPLFLLGYGRINFGLSIRDYREQFYEFAFSTNYIFKIAQKLTARLDLGWKSLEPSDSIFKPFDVYNIGFGLKMGEISNRLIAKSQFSLSWQIDYFARIYSSTVSDSSLSQANVNDTRNKLTIEATYNIIGSTRIYLKTDFTDISSLQKPLPISEKILFGGLSGLRGYRNDQFSARRLLLFELESRLYFSSDNYFYPFIDAAYYEYYNNNEFSVLNKNDDFIAGYGFGFNLRSDNRAFDITLSWGEDSLFDQPRLNIIVSNSF